MADRAQQWTVDKIVNLLDTNVEMVWRSILVLFYRQTADEQASHLTSEANGVGFSAYDAEFGSSLAGNIYLYTGLTQKQTVYAYRMAMKYRGQLVDAANSGEFKDDYLFKPDRVLQAFGGVDTPHTMVRTRPGLRSTQLILNEKKMTKIKNWTA